MWSCFSAPAPQGNAADWDVQEAARWLKAQKVKGYLEGKDGKELLEIKPSSIPNAPQKLLAALGKLQKDHAKAPVLLQAAVTLPSGDKELKPSPTRTQLDVHDQSPRKLVSPKKPAAAPIRGSFARDTAPLDARKNLSVVPQGPVEFAAALRDYTEADTAAVVAQYIAGLGKCGNGLVDALSKCQTIGRIFGTCFNLEEQAKTAISNKENISKLSALGQDVLRSLDCAGTDQLVAQEAAVQSLLQLLQQACGMAEVYTKDGWLLHMVCNERIKEEFDNIHNAIVDTLRAAALEAPNRALSRGDYRDASKAVRRTVKQLGNGGITQGLTAVGTDPEAPAVQELARQLEASSAEVAEELRALPRTDMPIEAYYSKMVQRQTQGGTEGEAMHRQLFDWYDKDGNGGIDSDELRLVLDNLGMLEGRKPAEADALIAECFRIADADGDGMISFEEFCRYYDTLASSNARSQLRLKLGLHAEDDLKAMYMDFSSFGTRQEVQGMDSFHFMKLCKDCNLLSSSLTAIDVDIIFSKCKPKGGRKLSFDEFLSALQMCADKKAVALEQLVAHILAGEGPIAHATKADSVRLHDDKSTYTGVYAKGGPKVAQKMVDLAAMLDRSAADARRATPPRAASTKVMLVEKKTPPPAMRMSTSALKASTSNLASRRAEGWRCMTMTNGEAACGGGELYDMFNAFATFGAGSAAAAATPPGGKAPAVEMDGSHFIKTLRECGLIDKALNTTSADLIFAKVKTKGCNKIPFEDFARALKLVAASKGMQHEQVVAAIVSSHGPLLTPSRA